MRTLLRNNSIFYYAKYESKDEITDEYGNSTGQYEIIYSKPIKTAGNISAAQGEMQNRQFGDSESYDKVIVVDDINIPIDEYSILWVDTPPINAIKDSWEAIKSGDWSNVEWGSLVIGVIEVIAGVVTALGAFKKIKNATDISDVGGKVKEVIPPVVEVDTHTSTLTTKLKSLAQNLGWGVLIVAEVAAAAMIFVGSIWLIGEILCKIADAWQPVLDNGGTTAIAIGIGTGILVAVGLATYGLGTLGAPIT